MADNAADSRLARRWRRSASADVHADWRELVARDDIDVVSVTGPNFIHRDVSVAVAGAASTSGWRSRPAATPRRPGDRRGGRRGRRPGPPSGFNYRNAPAVERAKRPDRRRTARTGRSGPGHDAGRLRGPSRGCADLALPERLVGFGRARRPGQPRRRPRPVRRRRDRGAGRRHRHLHPRATGARAARRPRHTRAAPASSRPVENEDYAGGPAPLRTVARAARSSRAGPRSASSARTGSRCTATRGALAWDFRRMGELQVCVDQDFQNASYAPVRRPRRRRVRRVPARLGGISHELRRPQGGRGPPTGQLDRQPARRIGATITDALIAAGLVDAMAESARQGPGSARHGR